MDAGIFDFSLDMFNLKGKVAMVTGGNTNLGMTYAIAFAKAGADLFIPHLLDDIDEVRAAVEAEGRRIEFYQGDLLDADYRKAMIARCMEVYGHIDILVNNAGGSKQSGFEDCPDEYFSDAVELFINVGFYLCRDVGAIMKKQGGGKIINIGSALSFTGKAGNPSYPTSKHGVIGLTRSVAANFRQDNIQCNAICPGFFKSAINAHLPEEEIIQVGKRLPGNEWGSFSKLMGTAVFLASEASDYVSGIYIIVDGGFSAGYF